MPSTSRLHHKPGKPGVPVKQRPTHSPTPHANTISAIASPLPFYCSSIVSSPTTSRNHCLEVPSNQDNIRINTKHTFIISAPPSLSSEWLKNFTRIPEISRLFGDRLGGTDKRIFILVPLACRLASAFSNVVCCHASRSRSLRGSPRACATFNTDLNYPTTSVACAVNVIRCNQQVTAP